MFAINWSSKAKKQLRKIDHQEQGTIIEIQQVRKRDEQTY